MSVQAIKDVAGLGIAVAELVDSVSDGVSLGEILSVVGVLKKVKPAVEAVKSGSLLDQYKALDGAAQAELVAWFNTELDLSADKVEEAVEKAWVVVLSLNELLKLIKP